MSNTYKFGGGSQKPSGDLPPSGVLPEGDYSFTVLECGEPYLNPNDRWVVKVKLAILPGNEWVWAQPWSGETASGEERDGIGDFLLAVNRSPARGKDPDWDKVIGAKGKCRLKIGKNLEGKERNEVAFFHRPKQLEQQNFSREEVEKSLKEQRRRSGATDEDIDIPF